VRELEKRSVAAQGRQLEDGLEIKKEVGRRIRK
jgi:hypothetical protein